MKFFCRAEDAEVCFVFRGMGMQHNSKLDGFYRELYSIQIADVTNLLLITIFSQNKI